VIAFEDKSLQSAISFFLGENVGLGFPFCGHIPARSKMTAVSGASRLWSITAGANYGNQIVEKMQVIK